MFEELMDLRAILEPLPSVTEMNACQMPEKATGKAW